MKSIRGKTKPNLPADWHEFFETKVNGRSLVPGTEVSISGQRGRFRFVRGVRKDDGTVWLDFWGGRRGVEAWRSFLPERVKTVHRIKITAKAMLEART